MNKGGARYTHRTLLAANLDEIAMEAHETQRQLSRGELSPIEMSWRFRRFSAEVEQLARAGSRHLYLLPPGPLYEPSCALAVEARAA